MKRNTFHSIAFRQLMTTPFRAETGIPSHSFPVYAAMNPPVPSYTPYRKISYYPHYSSYKQLKHVLINGYIPLVIFVRMAAAAL